MSISQGMMRDYGLHANQSTTLPVRPESKEADMTANRIWASVSGSEKTSVPMNKLMVKPMPLNSDAP